MSGEWLFKSFGDNRVLGGGVPLQKRVSGPFFMWCLYSSSFHTAKERLAKWIISPTWLAKNQLCNMSQKGGKRHNWVIFFWLVEDYIHFSYPKWSQVIMRSEIGKFEEENEKCRIQKCNQCVIHTRKSHCPPFQKLGVVTLVR